MHAHTRTVTHTRTRTHSHSPHTHTHTPSPTGPSSNLLAPSFGGGPNGSWSYLTGVSVTYTAALVRMLELADMIGYDAETVHALKQRRDLNMKGRGRLYLYVL